MNVHRWLVLRDFQHVAWPGHDPQGQGSPSPREIEISGRSCLWEHRPRYSPRFGQRHSMHRAWWILVRNVHILLTDLLSPQQLFATVFSASPSYFANTDFFPSFCLATRKWSLISLWTLTPTRRKSLSLVVVTVVFFAKSSSTRVSRKLFSATLTRYITLLLCIRLFKV